MTAGIDFGLVLLAQLKGERAAKLAQLAMEYDPHPPFDAGTPELAGAELTTVALKFLEPLQAKTRSTIADLTKP